MPADEKLDYMTFKKIKYDGQLPGQLRYSYNLDTMELINAHDYPDISDIITWNINNGIEKVIQEVKVPPSLRLPFNML